MLLWNHVWRLWIIFCSEQDIININDILWNTDGEVRIDSSIYVFLTCQMIRFGKDIKKKSFFLICLFSWYFVSSIGL